MKKNTSFRGRTCQHAGCRKLARIACEAFIGSDFNGQECGRLMCLDHSVGVAGLELCDRCEPLPHERTPQLNADQQPLF